MTKIHMKTDDVRETARLLDWTVGELYYAPFKLKNMANSIASAWQGGKSARYSAELRRQGEILQREVINLQRLATKVRSEVAQWEDADNNGASKWTTTMVLPTALFASGMVALPASQSGSFNWFGWSEGVTEGPLELFSRIPYDSEISDISYKGMGRALNVLADNKKAGFVGFMTDMGHVIKNPVIKEGLPLGLGIASDLSDGDSLSKAFISEGAEFLIDKGIYAIPVVGQFYLGYQLVLGGGHLISAGMELFGMHEEAKALQNTLETFDISERLGDAIADFVLNPPNLPLEAGVETQVQKQFGVEMAF